jgi:sugar/nucleoside kinase (ribokinase family)
MGNALVDIMTSLNNDELLEQLNLAKGSMQLADKEFINRVVSCTQNLEKRQSSGGSAANTIHGLAKLGVETGFVGKIGNDNFGNFFKEDLENSGINPKLYKSQNESGIAIALVSPDSERTFATFLGAAIELSADDIKKETFEGFDYFHIEGYLVQNHDLLNKAVKLAKENNLIVSIDMASFNVVEENLEFLKSLVKNYVDIVFANEEEAKAFTGKEPKDAVNEISEYCDIAIVKIGKHGSLIKTKNETYKIDVIEANSIDTTGAGDLYAAGFLYGLINNFAMQKCGNFGSILSGKVIEVIGAKMNNQKWKDIKELIENA